MDRQEFTALYERLRRPLYAYAAARLSAQVALDVVHDTFEVVWAKRDGAPSTGSRRAAAWPSARLTPSSTTSRARRLAPDDESGRVPRLGDGVEAADGMERAVAAALGVYADAGTVAFDRIAYSGDNS